VIVFTASGGVGKSTLVNEWLREMRRDQFRGASRVFGWSFYSLGHREDGAATDVFLEAALQFFGEDAPHRGSPWDKGERLARIAGAQRSLILLDGIEPLQSPHAFDRGKVRDPGFHAFLGRFVAQAQGLCVITSREGLSDFAGHRSVESHDLDTITPDTGRAMLRVARVVDTDAALLKLATDFDLHALTISLLGVYLHEASPTHHGGAVASLPVEGTAIERVLGGVEALLAAQPEVDVLHMVSLFDRPVSEPTLQAVRTGDVIPGMTELVSGTTEKQWSAALSRLARMRLIHVKSKEGSSCDWIDMHPLVRAYFASNLKEKAPAAWREGHGRLFRHLETSVSYRPEGLAGLQPLYQAISHGCKGLQHSRALEVFQKRVLRGRQSYSTKVLGAIATDLSAVASFFDCPWVKVGPLTKRNQTWLLIEAADRLKSLGRLADALQPAILGTNMAAELRDWAQATRGASVLVPLELTLGRISNAVTNGRLAISFADRSGLIYTRVSRRAQLADALNRAGFRTEAEAIFREAETMQAAIVPRYPQLRDIHGFHFSELLLADAERLAWRQFVGPERIKNWTEEVDNCHTVAERVARIFQWRDAPGWKHDFDPVISIALDHLTFGRASLYRAILENAASWVPRRTLELPKAEIDSAMNGLRASGHLDQLPQGLVTRAWLRVLENDFAAAGDDLNEASEIANRASMKLMMADVLLHRARLFRDKESLAKARAIVDSCGYGRRAQEIVDVEHAAVEWH
jgi:hypothetical protein